MMNQSAQLDGKATAKPSAKCGACGAEGEANAKFCGGCGQSLYEPCGGCSQPVLLTQKFCGGCGADLGRMLTARRDRHEVLLADAVKAAKESDFERALSLLRRVAECQDYRFADAVKQAEVAIEKVTRLRDQSAASIEVAISKAKLLYEAGDQTGALKILESAPQKLLTDEAKQILATARTRTKQLSDLESQLRSSIAEKNWPDVAGLLEQLLAIEPDRARYRELAEKVTGKLVSRAKELIAKRSYVQAIERLNAVPLVCQSDSYSQLRDMAENVHWLADQFDQEPFVSPMLGRLAVRFAKEVPEDREAKRVVKELAARMKQGSRTPRCHLPAWKGNSQSWLGGDAKFLGLPQSIDLNGQKPLRRHAARFSVAIGLALQGIGEARITEHFGPKQGLLGSLSRRSKTAWGIDIGNASIKAVCLEQTDEGVTVVDCYFQEFDAPLCRAGATRDPQEVIKAGISGFLKEHDPKDDPVWVNVPASKLVSRFVRLPPMKNKAAKALLQQEVERNVPIAVNELSVVTWMSEQNDDKHLGRPAYLAAARKEIVEGLLQTLGSAGLSVAGVQGETVALINFAAYEFAELLDGANVEVDGEAAPPELGEESTDGFQREASKTPTVAIVDCGASAVSLILISKEAQWSWTTETGGEDLTSQLAKVTTSTHAEAEKLKRDPSQLSMPSQYAAVENRQDLVRPRLESAFAEALRKNDRFDVVGCWCVGGGCNAHQWMRRVLQEK